MSTLLISLDERKCEVKECTDLSRRYNQLRKRKEIKRAVYVYLLAIAGVLIVHINTPPQRGYAENRIKKWYQVSPSEAVKRVCKIRSRGLVKMSEIFNSEGMCEGKMMPFQTTSRRTSICFERSFTKLLRLIKAIALWLLTHRLIGLLEVSPISWRRTCNHATVLPVCMAAMYSDSTGGEPLFTHWVCAEYMVGSETKYPAWTHWAHFDHFCNLPPICPPKYPPGTCWVFLQSTHHRTRQGWSWFTHWVHFDRSCNLPTFCPPKYPLGTCWVFLQSTHQEPSG